MKYSVPFGPPSLPPSNIHRALIRVPVWIVGAQPYTRAMGRLWSRFLRFDVCVGCVCRRAWQYTSIEAFCNSGPQVGPVCLDPSHKWGACTLEEVKRPVPGELVYAFVCASICLLDLWRAY